MTNIWNYLGHISRDCGEPRSNNFGGGGGGFRGGRGKNWQIFSFRKFFFVFKAVVAVAVAAIVIDVRNRDILLAIVPNQTIVRIPINKVLKMIIK